METDKTDEELVIEILKVKQWQLEQIIKSIELEIHEYQKRQWLILRDYGRL